jgi:hypothetical protein
LDDSFPAGQCAKWPTLFDPQQTVAEHETCRSVNVAACANGRRQTTTRTPASMLGNLVLSCSFGFHTFERALSIRLTSAAASLSQLVAQPRGQPEPAGAATDDNDPVPAVARCCLVGRHAALP